MNAVNLIPNDRRKASVSVAASPVTLGLLGGLVVVLVAAVLYVLAVNDVRTRKGELARVTANAAAWQAAANSYKPYVTAAQQRKQQIVDVRQLASGRFPWSVLLSQIGGVMPANAALSSLQATSPSSDATAAAATSSGPTAPAATGSAVQIAGCAASQSAVAATMVALNRVHGVSSVSLASTTDNGTSASGAQGGGGCPFPVVFQMSLVLAPSAASTATPSAATPSATPTASAATSSTGAAQ
jgi:Tfp pilus assembly protein PilN